MVQIHQSLPTLLPSPPYNLLHPTTPSFPLLLLLLVHLAAARSAKEMLLGKAPMRRTTSTLERLSLDYHQLAPASDDISSAACAGLAVTPQGYDHSFPATGSPRPRWRSSGDRLETAHFLRSCGFCNRRLAPGKDIYMYRGDAAFCSLECRQQQMNHDDGNCSLASVKNEEGSKASSKGGTVAAA